MRTEKINVRVFIEGVLVPKISAITVQTFANEEARASLVMPSIPGFETEELKRARVHIFWSDIEIRHERTDNNWPLLFEGEIVADGYSKSVSHRQQIFHCAGYHTYWEQVMLYYYDLSAGPTALSPWTDRLSVALGNEFFELTAQIAGGSHRHRLAAKILEEKDKAYHSLIKDVFRECMDTNTFFRLSDEALKLSNRFVSVKDPNLDVLIGRNLLHSAVTNDVLTVQGEASMMQLLKNVLELCRYQIVHNAQPVLVDGSRDQRRTSADVNADEEQALQNLRDYLRTDFPTISDTLVDGLTSIMAATPGRVSPSTLKTWSQTIAKETRASEDERQLLESHLILVNSTLRDLQDPGGRGEDKDLDKDGNELLAQFLMIPKESHFALPPACNVIFPGDQTSLSMDRQLMQEPTRGLGMPEPVLGAPFRLYLTPPELDGAKIPETIITPSDSRGLHPPVIRACVVTSPFNIFRKKVLDADGKLVSVKTAENVKGARRHEGIDISAPNFLGTDLYALDDGKVTLFNTSKAGGLQLGITYDNGITTYYCHLSSRLVGQGDVVKRGQIVAKGGNTGHSTGPHLHFEVWKNRQLQDPTKIAPEWGWQNVKGHKIPAWTDDVGSTDPVPTATGQEKSIVDDLQERDSSKLFIDHEFLTPEEEKTGIVPFFDRNTLRANAFMGFLDQAGLVDQHYLNMLNAQFLWRRYQTRSIGALSLPFNPYPVAGFPALVVDRGRSIIGQIMSITHNISVSGGQGSATTSVQIETPRYWDEGDPYHWRRGEVSKEASTAEGFEGRELPKSEDASFPAYYLDKLIGTNSSTADVWWDEEVKTPEKKLRPVDEFYRSLLGVHGIPYQYAERKIVTGQTVAYNKAIYGRDIDPNTATDNPQPANLETSQGRKKYPNTIVGRYYLLADKDPELAHLYVRNMTRRLGIGESELMSKVLESLPNSGGVTYFYSGPAFRGEYQLLVRKMNLILSGQPVFRG